MASILQSMKIVSASKRGSSISPIQHRRNKLISKLDEQIHAVKARQSGNRYTVRQLKRIKNKDTGEIRELLSDRRVREWWWTGDSGRLLLEVRYGVKTLEITKGKNAIEVTDMDELIDTLSKLKQATEIGEFDAQLMTVGGRFDKQVSTAKKQPK